MLFIIITLIILGVFWFFVILKNILFWVYLWQLKEYYIARFVDHFRTAKGQELILSNLTVAKLGAMVLFYFHYLLAIVVLLMIDFAEVVKLYLNSRSKNILKPTLTIKALVIILAVFSLEVLLISIVFSVTYFPLVLLVGDLLVPIFVFGVVLFFGPLTWITRKYTLFKAKKKIEQFKDLTVIGITGSYGKTSTKEFLSEILSSKFKVLKTQKNINAEIGIARTILNNLKPEHQILIVEIGAYKIGKIKEVCQMIKPKIGILTGINEQHLATFGSKENIIKAKHEIVECSQIGLEKDKIDLEAENISVEKEYVSFTVKGVSFRANVLGIHNIENLLLAIKAAQKLSMTLEEISNACLKIKPTGVTLLKREKPVIIDSSYSANPTGVIADLDYLNIYQGKKLIIMPCLIELGKSSKEIHQRIGRKINQVCDLAVITTKEYFKEIEKESGNKAIYIENPKQIIQKMKEFDIILLEGRVPKEIIRAWEQ